MDKQNSFISVSQVRQNAKVRLNVRPENNPGLEYKDGNGLSEYVYPASSTSKEDELKSYKLYKSYANAFNPCKSTLQGLVS